MPFVMFLPVVQLLPFVAAITSLFCPSWLQREVVPCENINKYHNVEWHRHVWLSICLSDFVPVCSAAIWKKAFYLSSATTEQRDLVFWGSHFPFLLPLLTVLCTLFWSPVPKTFQLFPKGKNSAQSLRVTNMGVRVRTMQEFIFTFTKDAMFSVSVGLSAGFHIKYWTDVHLILVEWWGMSLGRTH